jgi:hypothetical protein
MSSERKQILQMLAEGKITADEADRLLDALGEEAAATKPANEVAAEPGRKPKHLHIHVASSDGDEGSGENVNIKIPIFLLKAGLKLGGIVPSKARAKVATHLGDIGLDLNMLEVGKVDEFIKGLGEAQIRIVSDKEVVRIFCK